MSPEMWGLLIPSIVALLGAATAWLKAHAAQATASSADRKASRALLGRGPRPAPGPPPPPPPPGD